MALSSASGFIPATQRSQPGLSQRRPGRYGLPPVRLPTRNIEIAALRRDGSIHLDVENVPAIPLFENAFAAFARGTLIATPRGETAIEDLQPGDMVTTAQGNQAKLIWIGSGSFVPADTGRRVKLTRIMSDAFGQNRPDSFVTLGPGARILHRPAAERVLSPLEGFVDGVSVIEVTPPTPVRLFHLCLEQHAAIIAGGIEMETFHPGEDTLRKLSSSLRQRFLEMFPHITQAADFGPLAYPRVAKPAGLVS